MDVMTTTVDIPVWFLLCLVAIDIVLGALLLVAAELAQNKLAARRERRQIRVLEERVKSLTSMIEADAGMPVTEDKPRKPIKVEPVEDETVTTEEPVAKRPPRWKRQGELVSISKGR